MNTIIKYVIILIVALAYIGCNENEFLTEKDENRLTEADFWKDEVSIEAAMATVYSPLRAQMEGYWGPFRGFGDINSMGDDVFTIPGEEPATWAVASELP